MDLAANLWQQVQKNLADHNFTVAVRDLKKLYQKTPTKPVHQALVQALVAERDYRGAREYLVERLNDYRDSPDEFTLVIRVFALNHEFVQAQIMVNSVSDAALKTTLQAKLDQWQQGDCKPDEDRVASIKRALYHIGGEPLKRQQRVLRDAMNLPVADYTMAATGALADPFLNPAVCYGLLDMLRELALADSVRYHWIDGNQYQTVPKTLPPLLSMQSANRIMNLIQSRFEQRPATLRYLAQTFNLFLAYLYPRCDEVVTDADAWVNVAVRMQAGVRLSQADLSINEANAYHWQERLLQIAKSMK